MSAELDRLAAGCLLAGFEGTAVPEWLRRWLEAGLGGVVLFAWNVEGREQVAELTSALRDERPDLVVAIDEEGGDVTRLEAASGSSYPGSWALGVVNDVELTESVARAIGADLARAGINLNLAPVADVNVNPFNPIVGVRSFGADPDLVARHVAAFVTGLQRSGVAACAKHFPGHGDTFEDSHLTLPQVERDDETMAAILRPFGAAIDADVRAIMTAHIRISGLDELPATLSPRAIGLLRADLDFGGVVVTDALEMRAVSETAGPGEGAVRALGAGADALCLGAELRPESVHAAIVEAVRSGRLAEERVGEAASRVAGLGATPAAAGSGDDELRGVGLRAARRALESEGEVTLSRPPLVVELAPEPSIAAGNANHGLGDALQSAEVVCLHGAPLDARHVLAEHFGRQLVLVVRDAHRHTWERVAAEALLAAAPDAVLVEVGVPVWRPDGANYVATQGSGRVNLEAAAERLQPPP